LQPRSLLERQWAGYPATHRTRANLWLHLVAVPAFIGSNVALVVAVAHHAWGAAVVTVALAAASIGVQGLGHRLECAAAEPFSGTTNAICRLLAEQWITFPCFVLRGHWLAALRQGRRSGTSD
jgi:hypothetical protein